MYAGAWEIPLSAISAAVRWTSGTHLAASISGGFLGLLSAKEAYIASNHHERVRTINNCMIIGNLTRDPELRTTKTNKNVCTFDVAVNEGWGETAKTTFFHVSVFGKTADSAMRFLKKGRKVAVRGSVSASAYLSKAGKPSANLQLAAFDVEFLSPRSESEEQSVDPYSAPYPNDIGLPEDFTDVTDDEELPF